MHKAEPEGTQKLQCLVLLQNRTAVLTEIDETIADHVIALICQDALHNIL